VIILHRGDSDSEKIVQFYNTIREPGMSALLMLTATPVKHTHPERTYTTTYYV